MRRRSILLGLAAVAACLSGRLAGAPSRGGLDPLPDKDFTFEHARHLLMRAGFGGTVEEVQRLHRLGLAGMVDWLVDYEGRPDVVGPNLVTPAQRPPIMEIRRMDEQQRRRVFRDIRRRDQQKFQALRRWWVDRILRTRRPLEEKMTLFWHGHFTTSYRDVRSARLMWQQNELLRRYATGNFGDLLHEISKDPAMLDYLDNNQNRKGRPNENYAREVMELFTLGIGNYEEKDIKEAARAFTGWTFNRRSGRFLNNWRQHDTGRKTVFGKTGAFDGHDVCDLLLAHEACARHIAGKIFAWLACEPDDELRAELAAVFRGCNFEIKPLLRRIFKSKAFYSKAARGTQVKSPIVLLASTTRLLGMNPPPADIVINGAQQLGQQLMMPPNVKGWEEGVSWITTASLLDRNNLCGALLRAGLRGRTPELGDRARARMDPRARARQRALRRYLSWDPGFRATALVQVIAPKNAAELVDGLAKRILFVPLSDATRRNLIRFAASIGTPEVQQADRSEAKLRQLIHLLMSTPEFQMC